MINFRSDNNAGICQELLSAVSAESAIKDDAYGRDTLTNRLNSAFSDFFEQDVSVLPISTGTAANALALRCLCRSTGSVLCDANSHLEHDEANAVGFFLPGVKLELVFGNDGKIVVSQLANHLEAAHARGIRDNKPQALSIAQPTERGSVYAAKEIAALCDLSKANGLRIHMDGARFGNALAALGCSPADITWRCGVDVLSFGGTKNGAFLAEALIFFSDAIPSDAWVLLKQTGHNLSKTRFVSAQLLEFLRDNLYLRNAAAANARAVQIFDVLKEARLVTAKQEPQANIAFYRLPRAVAQRLRDSGVAFFASDAGPEHELVRFVTSYATTEGEIAAFADAVAGSADQD